MGWSTKSKFLSLINPALDRCGSSIMTAITVRKMVATSIVLFVGLFYPYELKSAPPVCSTLTFYNVGHRNMLVKINYSSQWINFVLSGELNGFQVNCPTSSSADDACKLTKLVAGVIIQHYSDHSIFLRSQLPEVGCTRSFQPPTNCNIVLFAYPGYYCPELKSSF